MAIPDSWQASAADLVYKYHKNLEKDDPETIVARAGHLNDFAANLFRERFYKIVGHIYVMALIRATTFNASTKCMSVEELRTELGVSAETFWRWQANEVTAGAEKFFAMQLLILDVPISDLEIEDDSEIFRQSVFAMYKFLTSRYAAKPTVPLSSEVYRDVRDLMLVMRTYPIAAYNPYDASLSEDCQENALGILAKFIYEKRCAEMQTLPESSTARALEEIASYLLSIESDRQKGVANTTAPPKELAALARLRSQVKSWLDSWGIAHVLFAIGYRNEWKDPGELS